MANTGTVTYSAEVIGNQTINVLGYTFSNINKNGDFPSGNYKITTVTFKQNFRNTSFYNFRIRKNNSSGTILSQELSAQVGGESTSKISSDYYVNSYFDNITALYLYGINGSSGELLSGSYITLTISWQLTDVATSISSITPSSVACGSSITISGTAAFSGYTHKLSIKFGDITSSATELTTQGTQVSGSISIPANYAAQIPNATKGTATAILTTYRGTNQIGQKSKTFTITVPNNATYNPTVEVTPTIINKKTLNGTEYILQNYSLIQLAAVATGKQGATIKGLIFNGHNLNQSYVGRTSPFSKTVISSPFSISGDITYNVEATDTRDRTKTTTTSSISVTPYSLPNYTKITAKRCDSEGNISDVGGYVYIGVEGATYTETIGSYSNTLSIRVEAKKEGGNYSSLIESSISSLQNPINGQFESNGRYTVRITILDSVTSLVPVEIELSSPEVLMVWKPENKAFGYGCDPDGNNKVQIANDWGLYHKGYDTFTAPILWSSDTGWSSSNITVTNDFSQWTVIEAVLDTGATGTLTYNSDSDDKSFRGVCIDPVTNGFRAFAIKIHVDSTTQLTLTQMEKLSVLSTGVSAYTAARSITKLIGIKHI